MYQPTTRLLTVLELLQARGSISGADLADRLEVDRRSIRRYVTMLQDLGIPVEGVRGPAGGYRLRPGYKLPPLMFTDGEAVALTLALIAVPRLGLAVDPAAANGALAKIERVLPVAVRDRVQAVQSVIAVQSDDDSPGAESDIVAILSHSATLGHRVRLAYHASSGDVTERSVDPFGVVNLGRRWYLAGYCHLRQDRRTFRIDRISSAITLDTLFDKPADADPLQMVLDSIAAIPGAYQVEVLFRASISRLVRQSQPGYGRFREVEGGVLFRCQIDDLNHIARYIVSQGYHFEVHEPPELKTAIRELAEELLAAVG
jgi:predicted DNA-binding transcriptional regulator YafY